MPAAPSKPAAPATGTFTKKAGPFPIWVWALMVIGLYWAYTKYKASSSTTSTSSTTTGSAEPSTAPYYVIENNLPQTSGTTSAGGVTVAPPGKGTKPPTTVGATGTAMPSGHPPVPFPSGPVTPALGSTEIIIYQTNPGDTWQSIASKYGISGSHLQQFNAQASNRKGLPTINTSGAITPGMQIAVPWVNK